ncbi:MAG: hypothetical protein ABIS50_15340 [Luteolibacter sp.]
MRRDFSQVGLSESLALEGLSVDRARDLLKALESSKSPECPHARRLYRKLLSQVVAACLVELTN